MGRHNQSRGAAFQSALAENHRYQLVGAFFVAVLLPWIVLTAFGIARFEAELIRNAVVANGVTLMLGYYVCKGVTFYPGVGASDFILPSFSATYGLVILGLVFFPAVI